jgi:Holliday junction resolvase RusA-like endonuclease
VSVAIASPHDGAVQEAAPYVIIELPGPPRGRHEMARVIYIRGKPVAVMHLDTKTKKYMQELRKAAALAMLRKKILDGPIGVGILATMPIPKSWTERERADALAGVIIPECKPDWDNIGKMCDALKDIVWVDDAKVAQGTVIKQYGEHPSLRIEVFRLQPRTPLFELKLLD